MYGRTCSHYLAQERGGSDLGLLFGNPEQRKELPSPSGEPSDQRRSRALLPGLALYQIHSATEASGVLENGEVSVFPDPPGDVLMKGLRLGSDSVFLCSWLPKDTSKIAAPPLLGQIVAAGSTALSTVER